jgi:hypothetical protein
MVEAEVEGTRQEFLDHMHLEHFQLVQVAVLLYMLAEAEVVTEWPPEEAEAPDTMAAAEELEVVSIAPLASQEQEAVLQLFIMVC